VHDFSAAAQSLIHYAKKLRNAVLFRECFVHIAGTSESISFDTKWCHELIQIDPDLFLMFTKACSDIKKRILVLNNEIHIVLIRRALGIEKEVENHQHYRLGLTRNPLFYRDLRRNLEEMWEDGN
jgi:hypothetical protein